MRQYSCKSQYAPRALHFVHHEPRALYFGTSHSTVLAQVNSLATCCRLARLKLALIFPRGSARYASLLCALHIVGVCR